MKISLFLVFAFAASIGLETSRISQAAPAPLEIGQCTETYISTVSTRLIDGMTGEPIPDSGVSVHLNNGIILIASTQIAGVEASQEGDKVKVCLQKVPSNCRTGDYRGIIYKVINHRTGREFMLSNSDETCMSEN
ncbi:hypothetical protein PCC7424_3742 [Gloeothece citriformis PCC 7424]|uniref:Uncharacterized protein n=1 Tax=Gloeothece citriformis (strain PCC 7424) TaxID=65393 RepID=B7KI26_GLOC7|nr:hypothetical protein [Gloeothece citriformis]ACK72123.1 hypothetical protein PCC7424_3742 [Gloeothece citriformis PCC 7424]